MRPLKRFSQNFLTNPFYQQKIVAALEIAPQDMVLEIGPGKGALTQHLVKIPCRKRFAIEIDRRLVEELQQQFGSQLELINNDILNTDLCSLTHQQHLKVVGNLPYHISSPILFHLIDAYRCLRLAVLMLQKEVALRICAKPNNKNYGILSVITQTYAQVEYLFEIKRGNFFPVPKVDSAVIRLKFYPQIKNLTNEALFRQIVRSAFNLRRKTLKNSLGRIFKEKVLNSLDRSLLTKRPEQLTIEDFKLITNQIDKVLKHETN